MTAEAETGTKSRWVRLRERWGVSSNISVVLILAAFALAGMSVLKVSRPIMNWILPPDAPTWLWWTVRVTLIPPIYEVILLVYGILLGQRSFFWNKQKRLWQRIFRRSSARHTDGTAAESHG